MNRLLFLVFFAFFCFFNFLGLDAQENESLYTFRLKNMSGFNRIDELVEIEVPDYINLNTSTLIDENENQIPFEIASNGKMRFLATVPAVSTAGFSLRNGSRREPQVMTYSQVKMPSTRADIAWENNLCAYRMYSTVLLNNEPNTAQGVDVWQKKMAVPVVDNMYASSNYHNESQYGMDVYSVNGKRLGCGGIAAVVNGKLQMHAPYSSCEFIEKSALKQVFKLTYDNVVINGISYTEYLTIETTANSILNKATFRLEGNEKTVKIAVGLYEHTDMGITTDGNNFTNVNGLIGRAELKSEGSLSTSNARFFQGAYVPGSNVQTREIDNHLCLLTDYKVGTDLVFYFGAGWNHFPQNRYNSDEDWFEELEKFKFTVDNPLTLTSFNTLPNKDDVLYILNSVNQTWQNKHPNHGDFFWNRAVYYIGNMHAYEVTQNKDYLDYATKWAERNNWRGQEGSSDPSKWKWTYGESYNYVLFGDNQVCFQVYADLYNLDPDKDKKKIERALEVMEYEISTEEEGYLWWVDGLFMVMPVLSKLYKITGNQLFLDKMYVYWKWYTDRMFDNQENLYYRDANFVYPQHKTIAEKKDFWARGDGWIFATFAKILQDIPHDDPHRDEYIDYYRKMADALKQCQQEEGYWERSLIDPQQAPGYETSGTAFFAYGYAWGINNGILSEEEYGSTLEKAWNYLVNIAYQSDGTVGYIQPIGSQAIPGQILNNKSYYDFGVGAFLMAAAEMTKLAVGDKMKTKLRLVNAQIADPDEIVLTFNTNLDALTANDETHYSINGEIPEVYDIIVSGNTVKLIMKEPLDFGVYKLQVFDLMTEDGVELAGEQVRNIILTVPLSPIQQDVSVTAIGAQMGNPAINVVDNNLNTRWSQEGQNQWIQIDLGDVYTVEAVDIAFYNGKTRIAFFNILTSVNGNEFIMASENVKSSGLTDELERFKINPLEARYVRIEGNGNTAGLWNSITEMRVKVRDNSLDKIEIPNEVFSDILLPETTENGNAVVWTSSDKDVMSGKGLVSLDLEDHHVTLTAHQGSSKKTFDVVVKARNPYANLQLLYSFNDDDVYMRDGQTFVIDHSKHNRDAVMEGIYGKIENGTLDLTMNKDSDFPNNSYLHVPDHLLDSIRSYTIAFIAKPLSLNKQPRFYDFGVSSANSIFLRANKFAAGYKYNGGTAALNEASQQIDIGEELKIAVTFDAKTMNTRIFIDGECVADDNKISHEPYEISRIGIDGRNYIGRTQWWDTNVADDNQDYIGTIDEFYMFSMPLNQEEITNLFDNMSTAISNTETKDYKLFDNKFYDISGRQVDRNNLKNGIYIYNGKKILIR